MKLSLDHLPRTARDLVDLIGLPAAMRLFEEYGGQLFQVPKGKRKRGDAMLDELSAVIGKPAAVKLSMTYGGEYLSVPLCYRALLAVRDAELQARYDTLLASGMSARAIGNALAKEFGVTHSTVQRASKRSAAPSGDPAAVADTRQLGLFPA